MSDSAGPVAPGSGWPGDPATPETPVAWTAGDVLDLAEGAGSLAELDARVSGCRACPRLVAWREQVAVEKRRAFVGELYWGRPVPGWGDHKPRVLIVGLAPAAHGGNRTGRIFTGDRSGDWLFAALHRAGLASRPDSTHAGDGQQLLNTRVVAAVRCAPPANKPTPAERDACAHWYDAELRFVLDSVRCAVALGHYAWDALFAALVRLGRSPAGRKPVFGHAAEARIGELLVIGSYHPSQQNTFTGKLTEAMLDAVCLRAAAYAGLPPPE
jgi:uracil-DNA glycosylase family 4